MVGGQAPGTSGIDERESLPSRPARVLRTLRSPGTFLRRRSRSATVDGEAAGEQDEVVRRRRRWPVVVVVVVVVVGAAGWWGRYRWLPGYRPGLAAGERYGIDVSRHQGEIDWTQVADDGIEFAYIKATEGGDFVDERFQQN